MKTYAAPLLTILLLSGCSTIDTIDSKLKAKPATLSSFVSHGSEMKPRRHRAPFALSYVNPVLKQRADLYRSVYIAPVATAYLRPARKPMTSKALGQDVSKRPVSEIAAYMKQSFEDAFRYSAHHRVRLTHEPAAGGVTIKLALIELNPTDSTGNVLKSALPGGALLAGTTAGNIAIEGKVTDNVTGEVLFEFADNEQDKVSLASIRDFTPYEHAKVAIREWARQIDELAHTPSSHRVEDSSSFTINPF